MRPALAQWARLTVFLAANGIALAALYFAVLDPALGFLADQRHQIEAGLMRLEQAAAMAERDRLAATLDPAEVERAAERFIQGHDEGLLVADLLTRLRRVGEEEGVSFVSVAALPPREWHGRSLVGARVEVTASTVRMAMLLSAIESGQTLLFINRAKLSAQSEERSDDTVTAVFDVYGIPQWPGA